MSRRGKKLTAAQAKNFAWANQPPVRRVVAALERAEPHCVRFVGGCVRDSLLGFSPKDIDVATTLLPDEVIAALRAADLGVAPTGIEHGTITAIADHKGVEVTTLRADVSTDGRRATVAFTRDWDADARRRDFTVNALYLTPQFDLFDPVGGLFDLDARAVRFIGAAQDRIREDYLRILRFFRFSARFASGFDADGLDACAAMKSGMKILSAERIGDEIMKLLALPSPQAAVSAMQASGVLTEVWSAPPQIETLARLKSIDPAAPPPLSLAALFGENGDGIDRRIRLSNAQALQRKLALSNAPKISAISDERGARALLYRMGVASWRDAVLLCEARRLADSETPGVRDSALKNLATLPDRWPPPLPPFSGKDALAAGVAEGPSIAAIIKAAEQRWIDEDFPSPARARDIFNEEAARLTSKG